jgi:hypothetical protein
MLKGLIIRKGDGGRMPAGKVKPILVLLVIGLLVAGAVGYFWYAGYFSPSPPAVLRQTYTLLNEGRYDEAISNLTADEQEIIGRHADRFRRDCKLLTKEGTIRSLDITSESTAETGDVHISFTILYKNGQSLKAYTIAQMQRGQWRVAVIATLQDVLEMKRKEEKQKVIPLDKVLEP